MGSILGGLSIEWLTVILIVFNYGSYVIRCSFAGTVLHILYITITLKSYEKSTKTRVFLYFLLTQFFAIIFSVTISLVLVSNFNILYIVILLFDTGTFACALFTRRWNHKLRKNRLTSNLSLNERYQVNQNLYVLDEIFNFVIAAQVIEILCVISIFVEVWFQVDFTRSIAAKVCLPLSNFILYILPLITRRPIAEGIVRDWFIFKIFKSSKNNKVEVVDYGTQNNHFDMLRKAWD